MWYWLIIGWVFGLWCDGAMALEAEAARSRERLRKSK